jgi:hypothetical protein
VASATTETGGAYRFENLEQGTQANEVIYCLLARRPGHSSAYQMISPLRGKVPDSIRLSANPGTLSGRVIDEQGRAVAGALVGCVRCGMVPVHQIQAAETDEFGRYTISDLPSYKPAPNTWTFFWIRHPEFPLTSGKYAGIPSVVDVTLPKGGLVEGRVMDTVTGRPATGATIMVQGVKEHGSAVVRTDAEGKYRLILTADHYNIRAEAVDRTCVALDSFDVQNGAKNSDVELELIEGGYIVGRVTDAKSGKPLPTIRGMAVTIGHHGPAFPRSGAAVGSTFVHDDGTYRLRVAPGDNFPYIMMSVSTERSPRSAFDHPPIHVKAGQVVELNMTVHTGD